MPRIAFQGEIGAYGHEACRLARPGHDPLPCPGFEDAIAAVRSGAADLGMIAVENSTYGRVADVHQLLPDSGLFIVDEVFLPVRIALLAPPGATLETVRRVRGMAILLGQARRFVRERGYATLAWSDNAAGAAEVARLADPAEAALASEIAAGAYGLQVLARGVEDQAGNTTRFLVMAREADLSRRGTLGMMTSLVFRVRNIPAALYKALGGFATNGVNVTKLESYLVGGRFQAAQFYAEVEGHPDDPPLARALEELRYFSETLRLMGVFPAARLRHEEPAPPAG
ncbi:prephenate dehydratase [Rubellimicrobium sp. CFH 75288]|uniref:prephenate dehydratase n=1 Tax=Rubellimicrobium sp. CFH 75288 TaxID=2697034 RepID=UPI001412E1FB|nr:prephenate dehydratase [Rubellimicrobium sp. CFH 75288]NAZ35819.1 prephenate dehydratase [Rubellimicrobium sp. CFH 75288]